MAVQEIPVIPQGGRPPARSRRRWAGVAPYLWISPSVALFAIFVLLPVAVGLLLSLTTWNGTTAPAFDGLGNYVKAIHDGQYWTSVVHNVEYAVGTVIGKMVLGLGLALLMNQALPGRGFFRTALFLPVTLSFVVVGLLWSQIYDYDFGLIDSALRAVHLQRAALDWLGNTNTALPSLIAVDVWKWFGFHMVIFLAGLQSLPQDAYEAAEIDGATAWQRFRHITMPLLVPITLLNVVIATAGAFNVFDLVYVMTQGGPVSSTNVAMLVIYKDAFQFFQFGYAAALSVVQLVLVAIVSLAILLLVRGRGQALGTELS